MALPTEPTKNGDSGGGGGQKKKKESIAASTSSFNRLLESASLLVISSLEKVFYRWGHFVASHPYPVIACALALTAVCASGFLNFTSMADVQKLYLPPDHIYLQNKEWRQDHFPDIGRGHFVVMVHEENVLTPDGLMRLLELHERLGNVEFNGSRYKDVCLEIPITDILMSDNRKRPLMRKRRQATGDSNEGENGTDYDSYDNFNFYTGEVNEDDEEELCFDFYTGDYADCPDEQSEEQEGETQNNKKEEEEEDKGVDADSYPPEIWCDLVGTLNNKCGEYSLLEIWSYDKEKIRSLTQQDIIDAVNTVKKSPIFSYDTDFTDYLGGQKVNATGHVVAATAMRSIMLATYDADKVADSQKVFGVEFDLADPFTMAWEAKLVEALTTEKADLEEEAAGYDLFFRTARSFGDEGSAPVEVDFSKMIGGYIMMFLYVSLLLGNLNLVEGRFYLAIVGLLNVGFGIVIALGLTAGFSFWYTPIHGVLPFLALGIGIDNMFVILRCLENIPEEEREQNGLVKNIALTMARAGVSITVTTATDVAAFGVGTIAVLPALKHFCVSSAIAIAAIYLLQITWFVAFVTLDQRRIKSRRNALIPCIVHKDWTPSEWSRKDYGAIISQKFSKLLYSRVFAGIVMLITAAIFAVGMYGTLQIKVDFDPVAVLPPRSQLKLFVDEMNVRYPTNGFGAFVYTGELPFTLENFEKVDKMVSQLHEMALTEEIISYGEKLPLVSGSWDLSTGFWWNDLKNFMREKRNITDWRVTFEDGSEPLAKHLSDFLHREEGAQDVINFKFDGNLTCDVPAPKIMATKLGAFTYNDFDGPTQHIPAQDEVDRIVKDAGLPSYTFSDSTVYISWQTDRIIGTELWRNMGLCLICVFLLTLLLLADIKICFLVMTCVLFTMVAVTGGLYFWNQSIDAFVCVFLVICIGLCVDYSAHIAHAFIICEGTSTERSAYGFAEMGAAIFHGGSTTFVALSFLGLSESMVFIVFFKVFFLTVLVGMFHGLVYLPVMLAVFGSDRLPQQSDKDGAFSKSRNCEKGGIGNPEFVLGETPSSSSSS